MPRSRSAIVVSGLILLRVSDMDPNLEVTINRSQDTVAHSFTPRGGKRSFLRSRRQEWHDFQDYWSDSIAASSWTNARSTFDAWLIAAAAQVSVLVHCF